MSESIFSELAQDPPIEVFELIRQYNEDTHPNKVNLSVGGSTIVQLKLDFQMMNVIAIMLLFNFSVQGRQW